MAKYTDFCSQILEKIGGKDNVSGAVHCMTRLRLSLKDKSKADVEGIKEIKGVLGAQFSGEQFQIIIGQHVSEVYPEFCKIAEVGVTAAIDENLDKEPFNIKKVPAKILDYISGSLAPVIVIMMGCCFFRMFYSVLGSSLLGWLPDDSDFMQTLYIVGEAGFYFLPVFVAWGAAKKLNTNIALALLLGALLLDPNVLELVSAGEGFNIFGIVPMQLYSYSSTIIPSLLTVWVMKYVYSFLDKHMPQVIKVIGVPFCTLVVMVPVMFGVLAPAGRWIGVGISSFFSMLSNVAGPLAIGIIAAFWPFLVASGMHIAAVQFGRLNITELGYDPVILAGANIANYALMGMTVAFFLRSKREERQLGFANMTTLIIGGISEPTLFSVLLRNKRAMACQIIGGFVGGLVGGIMGVAVYTVGTSNFLTVLQYAGGPGSNFICACIACAVAFVVALAVGIVIGFDQGKDAKPIDLKKFKKAEA